MSHKLNPILENDEAVQSGFRCGICNEWHSSLPMSYSAKVPSAVATIPELELDHRVVFTLDQCIIDKQAFFLRGRIPIPVIGRDQPFIWGVWARVSEVDFFRTNELWKVQGREAEPPYPAWLNTPVPQYEDTLNLELRVLTQIVGRRPHFELVDATHPLAIEQRKGISMQRVQEIAEDFIHPKIR